MSFWLVVLYVTLHYCLQVRCDCCVEKWDRLIVDVFVVTPHGRMATTNEELFNKVLLHVLMVCIIGLALLVIVVFAEAFSCVSLSGLGDDQ